NKDIYMVKENIKCLGSNITEEINKTRQMVEDSSISNVWLDLFGVFNIIIGLIYGTIPELICKII
ncbi:MAG: hypothetical protein Q8S44_05975, partial [Flavobacteriaceae bacterium]|nr:hypothetical protein [Flavobacteriaceae bacterium]